jgi:ADP-heptose:LPS heptosyltransferase
MPRKKRKSLKIPDCKHFTGYKPCFPQVDCTQGCIDNVPRGKRILIINLDAMGHVLVTTSLLPAIKRKYPKSHVSWITLANAAGLLENNQYVDRVYVWGPESWLILQSMKFDLVLNVDKSHRACSLTTSLRAKEKLGFGMNADGVIVPLNKEAEYLYRLGLDDRLKFRLNQKPLSQILHETFKLKYKRDEYILGFSPGESAFCRSYRKEVGIQDSDFIIGFNTGCSPLYPNKKMTIEQHVSLIDRLHSTSGIRILLLGGPEDTERNAEIVRIVGDKVIDTPTRDGLRRGICYENLCDLVITGDTFGMHLAIALKKQVIVWFGVSCWSEIELYGRGVKLIPEGLECSPCWKHQCPYDLECIQMIDLDRICDSVVDCMSKREKSFKVETPATTAGN